MVFFEHLAYLAPLAMENKAVKVNGVAFVFVKLHDNNST